MYSGLPVWRALPILSAGLLAWLSMYEIGYIENDMAAARCGDQIGQRLTASVLAGIGSRYRLIIFAKWLVTAALVLITRIAANAVGARIAVWRFVLVLIGAHAIFTLHNLLRSRLKILTFFGLYVAKYLALTLLFPIRPNWSLATVAAVIVPLPRLMEYSAKEKFGFKRWGAIVGGLDCFRVKYYAAALVVFSGLAAAGVFAPRIFVVLLCYMLLFRGAALVCRAGFGMTRAGLSPHCGPPGNPSVPLAGASLGAEYDAALRKKETIKVSAYNGSEIRPKISFIVTSAASVYFFRGQLAYIVASGLDVEMISAPGARLEEVRNQGATNWAVPMEREIALAKDIVSLWRLWRHYRIARPTLVVAGTPKAGLLGALAARLAGVPIVVYSVHGLRLETASGWKRSLLWTTEWLACHAAHEVRCVSPSLMARVTELGMAGSKQCLVVCNGSSNGVNIERWRRTAKADETAQQTRERLGIPPGAQLVGFVGRLTRDKGIAELYEAFTNLRFSHPDLRLLLVGDFEEGDPVSPELRTRMECDAAVICTGYVSNVEVFYWAMDILALPTYREGFPGAPLEAQAASIPVVTTDATGAVDAVVDGVTGLRVHVGDVEALTMALDRLLGDSALRARMGQAGSSWVEKNFRSEIVWENLLADYRSLLRARARKGRSDLRRLLKSGFDRLAAGLILIPSLPLLLAAAIAIRCSMGSPVVFRQKRLGFEGRPFQLLKFRTMIDKRDSQGALLDDRDRLTSLGRLLRALSVDELPQLWNVLRGEMSLVGPRPLLPQYLDRYTCEQARRHEVLPGMTGWAQVNGRNAISWEGRFAFDIWYVDHWSIWLDLKILWMTVAKVLHKEGIFQTGDATMPEFQGK